MKRIQTYIIMIVFVWVGGVAYGQTATPHPNALPVGLYQFEDLASPEIELTGADWSIRYDDFLGNDTDTETLTFHVTQYSDYLIIYQMVSGSVGAWSVCVDASCSGIVSDSMPSVAVDLFETNSQVTITIENDNETLFDFMTVIESPQPEITPEPYYIYSTVSGSSGSINTRFDMVVTAGEVGITSALLFLFFSLWAIIFMFFFIRRDSV